MSTGKTENVGLNLWEPGDSFIRTEFNADNEKIDQNFETLFSSQVKVESGSYVGTGKGGSSYPNSLTFSFVPKLVLIMQDIHTSGYSGGIVYIGQPGKGTSSTVGYVLFSLSGTTLSWYNKYDEEDISGSATRQLNTSGSVYHYVAIGTP